MTSHENSQEGPPTGTLHVDSGTRLTANTSPKVASLESNAPQSAGPQHTKLHLDGEPPAMISVTETGRSDSILSAPETDSQDDSCVVSMPVAVPPANAPHRASSSLPQSSEGSDGVTAESAPDERNIETSIELDDIMPSPDGKDAIVERSPGGRYVRFMEKLGSGASKDVYRAYDTQEGIEVAWNVVHLAGVPKNERIQIVNEVRLLERLHHHNIISFHGSWVNREKQQVNFVTEILSSGTLQSFINKVQVIRWKIAKRWALQILKGLEYLHSQDPPVIHRDLKCENIFINGTSGDLRIGDLGLSTVHQNGKALSVLGTPEFMAPDMYEETAYDEKVDIYAFGMCLLEIFTKEIPYRECSNPAQIYKKVIRGDPPDCLKRLKSRHARDFIILCLGTKDENGSYVRPSATELIAHPFLQFRPVDDDEVEVDPPIQERTIRESPETSGGSKAAKAAQNHVKKPFSSTSTVVATNAASTAKMVPTIAVSTVNKPRELSMPSSDEIGPDTYEEMPDSETAFRQPKVLMGRGQELLREEVTVRSTTLQAKTAKDDKASKQDVLTTNKNAQATPLNGSTTASEKHNVTSAPTKGKDDLSAFHFLVAAAVLEDELSSTRPYGDDILKLEITLSVEGQTQNLHLDFHLIKDDAIRVAKDIVAELGIPQAAVIEMSETISGLARAARVKQDKYMARINATQHQRSRSVSQSAASLQLLDFPEITPSQHQSIRDVATVVAHSPHPDHMNFPSIQQQGHQISQKHASTSYLPAVNPPFQSQPMLHMSQTDQSVQAALTQGGHVSQQQQQSLSGNSRTSTSGTVSTPPTQGPGYDHAPIVRSMSNGPQADVAAAGLTHGGPFPMQQKHIQMQNPHVLQQGQIQDGQVPVDYTAVQGQYQQQGQIPVSSTQQQVPNGQPSYVPPQMQDHVGIQQAQAVQTGGQHSLDGQDGNGPVPTAQQHGPVPTAQQHAHFMKNSQPRQPQITQGQVILQQPQQGQGSHVATQVSFNFSQHGSPPPPSTLTGMQFQGTTVQSSQSYQAAHDQQLHEQYMRQGQSFSQNHGMPQQPLMFQPPGHPIQSLSMASQNQGYRQAISMPPLQMQPQRSQPVLHKQHPPHVQAMPLQSSAQGHQLAPIASQLGFEVGGQLQPPLRQARLAVEIHHNSQTLSRPIVSDESAVSASEKISSIRGSSGPLSDVAAVTDSSKSDHIGGILGVSSTDIEDDDFNDEKLAAELRKLDEDFQKTMARAQKVFDSRMDNLSRSQVQREVQHQKTLEKHEKERADFEKRRQHEEIAQNRRIDQLRRDWAARREAMRQKKQMEEAQAAAAAKTDEVDSSDVAVASDL